MKKVLITGATGFVGSNLARRCLDIGYDVNLILRENSNTWRIKDILNQTSNHVVSLENKEAVTTIISKIKPQLIFHLAAYATFPSQKDAINTINSNLIGTINLLDACNAIGFDCFINTGSSSEYGKKQMPMKENDVLEPQNLYGITKSASTLYCQHVGRENNLPISTLRLFSAFGDYEDPSRLIPTVLSSCINEIPIKLSSPSPARDFIYIDDVLDLFIKLTSTPNLNGEIFNAGTGIQHSVGEIVEICLEISKSSSQPEWGVVEGRTWDTDLWVADVSKTRTVLNWKPNFDIKTGLQKTLQWFISNAKYY